MTKKDAIRVLAAYMQDWIIKGDFWNHEDYKDEVTALKTLGYKKQGR